MVDLALFLDHLGRSEAEKPLEAGKVGTLVVDEMSTLVIACLMLQSLATIRPSASSSLLSSKSIACWYFSPIVRNTFLRTRPHSLFAFFNWALADL